MKRTLYSKPPRTVTAVILFIVIAFLTNSWSQNQKPSPPPETTAESDSPAQNDLLTKPNPTMATDEPMAPQAPPANSLASPETSNQKSESQGLGSYPEKLHLPQSPGGIHWSILLAIIFLSASTFGLSFYSYRLTRLRLQSRGGSPIILEDSLREWMVHMDQHWKSSQQLHRKTTKFTLQKLTNVSREFSEFSERSQDQFTRLAEAFKTHHQSIGKEIMEIAGSLAETREILAAVRAVAEEKKAELEEYKAGYRISMTKETLGYLCNVRDHLIKMRIMIDKNPGNTDRALQGIEDIDWELRDTLDTCDLVQIEIPEKISIRDPALRGKHKITGRVPAPTPDLHGVVAEVIKHGYLIRVNRPEGEETIVFRPVNVTVFHDENLRHHQSDSDTEASTENHQLESPSSPSFELPPRQQS